MNTLGGLLSQYSAMCESDASAGAEAMAQMLDKGEDSTSAGDEGAELPKEADSDVVSGTEGESAGTEGLVDDLEPNWDEALTEQLEQGPADEAKAEESGDEPEPNWDEALTEQLEQGPADEAKAEESGDVPEPNWEDALVEQQQDDQAGKG